MDGFEVERDFPRIGRRSILVNARHVSCKGNQHATILLGLVAERRKTERKMQKLLDQQKMLLSEMSHRVANSLQIIASMLMMKARLVVSPETRLHLQDAHQRVMSIACVQLQLHPSEMSEKIAVAPYLSKLCATLRASMIGEKRAITIKVTAAEGEMTSNEAVSLGLIAVELLINAIKNAFPDELRLGQIDVVYEVDGDNWKLTVSDNGVGMSDIKPSEKLLGLGTTLLKALAQQLDAKVEIKSSQSGSIISITHAEFAFAMPTAA